MPFLLFAIDPPGAAVGFKHASLAERRSRSALAAARQAVLLLTAFVFFTALLVPPSSTSPRSIPHCPLLPRQVGHDIALAIAANKQDLPERVVPDEKSRGFAAAVGAAYYRTSAKTGAGIEQVWTSVDEWYLLAINVQDARLARLRLWAVSIIAADGPLLVLLSCPHACRKGMPRSSRLLGCMGSRHAKTADAMRLLKPCY